MRVLLCAALLVVGGCASGRPKPPDPIPEPTPIPGVRICSEGEVCGACQHKPPGQPWTLLPLCPPTDCATLESFKIAVRVQARVIVDATPGHGFPACSATEARPCRAAGSFERLSPEGGSIHCEVQAGPYTWTLDGAPCEATTCFPVDTNPLLYVFRRGGLARVTGGNGAWSEVAVP